MKCNSFTIIFPTSEVNSFLGGGGGGGGFIASSFLFVCLLLLLLLCSCNLAIIVFVEL